MGCDIHWSVERRRDDGLWERCEGAGYDERNYDLFAALANVRNCYERVTPIAEPRGMPHDVSPEVKAESDAWDPDGHSHSWHTLETLLAYDWEANRLEHFRRVLVEMAKLGPPDRVRAVFFFDN